MSAAAPQMPFGSPVARPFTITSLTGGWNALEALDAMPNGSNGGPSDAVVLDNWFPETTSVRMRRGYVKFCDTGTGKPVKSLIDWYGDGQAKVLAAAGGGLYECSTGTPVALGYGYASDVWESTIFSTLGGQYAVMANGLQVPQTFDGSTITPTTFFSSSSTQPLEPKNLVCPISFISRLWFFEKGTLRIWYGGTGAFSGAMSFIDLGPLFRRGGEIAVIGTWNKQTITNAIQEQIVIVSSNGEVLTYSGTDPESASTFSLSGHYLVGVPVAGRRSAINTGADLILITQDGFEPVSTALPAGQAQQVKASLSLKIGNAVTAAALSGRSLFGWCGMVYGAMNSIWFNVPQQDGTYQQFAMNTLNNAWCRFLNQPALCLLRFGAIALFGSSDGVVYQADSGTSDNGQPITADLLPAYRFPARGQTCRFVSIRPIMQVTGPVTVSCEMQTDFQTETTLQAVNSNVSGDSVWGSMIWGEGTWGQGSQTLQRNMVGVSAIGYAGSPRIRIQSSTISVRLNSIDVYFEQGGFV